MKIFPKIFRKRFKFKLQLFKFKWPNINKRNGFVEKNGSNPMKKSIFLQIIWKNNSKRNCWKLMKNEKFERKIYDRKIHWKLWNTIFVNDSQEQNNIFKCVQPFFTKFTAIKLIKIKMIIHSEWTWFIFLWKFPKKKKQRFGWLFQT